jgi:hypothetical protein
MSSVHDDCVASNQTPLRAREKGNRASDIRRFTNTAILVAPKSALRIMPISAPSEAMFTILPRFRATIPGRMSLQHRMVVKKFTSTTKRQTFSVDCRNGTCRSRAL